MSPQVSSYEPVSTQTQDRLSPESRARHEPASARGWRVTRLECKHYPSLVRDERSHAVGRFYLDLRLEEWTTLDAFEDPGYHPDRAAG